MTKYKKYLFDKGLGGDFHKPDLDEFQFDGYQQELYDKEVERLNQKDLPLEKTNNGKVDHLLVGSGGAEIMNNGQYLKISFTTSEGPLEGKIWGSARSNLNEAKEHFDSGSVFSINGRWNEWPAGSGKFTVIVDSYIEKDVDPNSLVPWVQENRAELEKELHYYISTMSEDYQVLANKVLEDIWPNFSIAPAAKGHHHYQHGGLLQHTVELLRIADQLLNDDIAVVESLLNKTKRMIDKALWSEFKIHREENPDGRFFSSFYEKEDFTMQIFNKFLTSLQKEKPNRDVVIFSIIFHDMGKILEYSYAGEDFKYDLFFPGFHFKENKTSVATTMDVYGSRIGHITLGMMYIQKKLSDLGFIDGDFLFDVLSCISSHHGKKEWGSPTEPSTPSEFIVHISDYIDAKFANEK